MELKKSTTRLRDISLKTLFAVGCLCVFFSASGFGKTPHEYRRDISQARRTVLRLLYPDEAEKMSAAEQKKYESDAIRDIRQKMPATEKIEFEASIIETENGWLTAKLNDLEEESQNSAKRTEILNEIEERLSSLERKVTELESSLVSERTKDDDKQKLAEILRREEFQRPEAEEKSLFQRFWDWLMSLFPKAEIPGTPVAGSQPLSFILQLVVFGLVLGIIGFLAYRFAPYFVGRFRRTKTTKNKERVVLGEKLSPDQRPSDIFGDAERLAREGDLRGAIRKGYISLLCELNDRRIIGLSQHKTNRDYLRDIRNRRELHQDMKGLTLNFERHWYGFDPADATDWEEFKSGYKKAVSVSSER